MKKLILSFACGFISLAAFSQSRVELVKTFKVEHPVQILSPSGTAEILKDNSLGLGIVRVVLVVEHNANEAYNDIVLKRFKGVQSAESIGFEGDTRSVTGRNGFTLEEKTQCIVFMSDKTSKLR